MGVLHAARLPLGVSPRLCWLAEVRLPGLAGRSTQGRFDTDTFRQQAYFVRQLADRTEVVALQMSRSGMGYQPLSRGAQSLSGGAPSFTFDANISWTAHCPQLRLQTRATA